MAYLHKVLKVCQEICRKSIHIHTRVKQVLNSSIICSCPLVIFLFIWLGKGMFIDTFNLHDVFHVPNMNNDLCMKHHVLYICPCPNSRVLSGPWIPLNVCIFEKNNCPQKYMCHWKCLKYVFFARIETFCLCHTTYNILFCCCVWEGESLTSLYYSTFDKPSQIRASLPF